MAGDDRHKKKLLHPSVLEEEVEEEEEEEEEEGRMKGNAAHSGLDAASMRSTDGRSVLRLGSGSSQLQVGSSQKSKNRAEISSNNKKIPEPLRRAVAACLSASLHQHHLHQQAFLTLQDYLSNPSTVDIAYVVLLEHANAERERSPPVVSRCVLLLKRYLVRYIPKPAMLQQVDTFCAVLIAECNSTNKTSMASTFLQGNNDPVSLRQSAWSTQSQGLTKAAFASAALVKSLTYVRSLVARYLPSNLLQSTRTAEISRSRVFHSSYGPSGSRGPPDVKDSANAALLYNSEECVDYITNDILKWRWMDKSRQQCWAPSPVMTDSGGIARPQVKRLYEFSDMGAGTLFMKSNDFKVHRQHVRPEERKSHSDMVDDQLLQPSKVTTVVDRGSSRSHLRAITALKRQKTQSQVWDSDAPKSTWRRRPRPLFQYKHYSEQQPLRIKEAEIEEVISAFCVEGGVSGGNNPVLPNGRLSVETADVAGSVLIKLIMDMYIADPVTAAPLTFSMLEGMLSSPSMAVRIRCFDLLLNLGIHAHFLEPIQIDTQPSIEEEPSTHLGAVSPFLSSKRGLNLQEAFRAEERTELRRPQEKTPIFNDIKKKGDTRTPETVKSFELWMLQILFEMLLFLVQTKEKEEAVWASALSCLVYFICDCGRVQRERLHGIDIRVLKVLLDISWKNAWANELHCTLVCMMSNMLYKIAGPLDSAAGQKVVFDMEQFNLAGGIEFICLEYVRAKSSLERTNLFCVVLDFILIGLNNKHLGSGKPCLGFDDIQPVVSALCLADAAESVGFALKHGLKNVGGGLFKAIAAAMSRDIDSGRLNSGVLEEVTCMIDDLVSMYAQPAEEFSELMSITRSSKVLSGIDSDISMKSSDDSNTQAKAWATLCSLLHSSEFSCRSQGYSWLADVLSHELTHGNINMFDVLPQSPSHLSGYKQDTVPSENSQALPQTCSALHVFYGLLRSKHATVRRGFILVLERLLVRCQQTAISSFSQKPVDSEMENHNLTIKKWEKKILEIMSAALWQFVSVNDANHINILQMCDVMLSQLCIVLPPSQENPSTAFIRDNMIFDKFGSQRNSSGRLFPHVVGTGKSDNSQLNRETKESLGSGLSINRIPKSNSLAAMLLNGEAAAPRVLIANIPTDLLYWPLLQLAGAATEDMALGVAVGSQGRGRIVGGASDVRAAVLVLLIGKCSAQQSAFNEVGGEEFFRSLLDDTDARVAYYTASFLLKRMMSEEPEKYQQVLHMLVFRAQQCNNEKILENPYLQMRGILQLANDVGSNFMFQET